jgi:nucleoside-diphosphate-sugar epimerase
VKLLVTGGAGYIGSVVAHQLNLGNGSGYSNPAVCIAK